MANLIPIFYRSEMVADSGGFSPSAAKPALVVGEWLHNHLPLTVIPPEPLTRAQIRMAHDSDFVDDILSCELRNGHGNRSEALAATLPYTCGAMLTAAECAIANGVGAVAPVSGFHHAGYDFAGGFCTFNGLMVAAMNLPMDLKVGILDCDYHYGNGTANIIAKLGQEHRIVHYSMGRRKHNLGREFIKSLPDILVQFKGCDVVLYQAGADAHKDDPLGGCLSTRELLLRDRIVFEGLRAMAVPVAWNLAGGYQDDFSKVVEIHSNTMKAFAESFFQ